jgi:ABC-type bacteriocin/lantibiotic exporter with double-glycine peptidase domain
MTTTLLLALATVFAAEPGVSCGATCTFLFMRDHGGDFSLDRLSELLSDRADGHTFAELRDVCTSHGVPATIVNARDFGRLPKEPFVAHFRGEDGDAVGHYVFLRPLEPTFTQYQLVAPPLPPEVVTVADLLARSDFTGWVLVRSTSSAPALAGWSLVAVGLVTFATAATGRRWRLKKVVDQCGGRLTPPLTPPA